MILEELFFIHKNVIRDVPLRFKRYIYDEIDFNAHSLCIYGARGVGKTTLLLQYCFEKYNADPEKCLYVSGDNVNITAYGLYKTAKEYFKYGGEALIIDEVHKYPQWSQEVKNIIDTFKGKKIFISGSSEFSLKRGKYDLSRRIVYYELKGLSFREFLNFELKNKFKTYHINELIKNHTKYSLMLSKEMPVLKYFIEYLKFGYYPFYAESRCDFVSKLNNVIEKILFEDIGVIFNVRQSHMPTLRKILWLITSSHPFVPNIDKMSKELKISREYVYNYLEYLEHAGLIISLRDKAAGYKLIRKPGKLYIENTNLINAITGSVKIESRTGNIRETFFANQVRNSGLKINMHERADFIVNDKLVFEVGGFSKTEKQIKSLNDSYLAVENLEIGHGNRIPLYLFGFLY